MAYSIDLPDGGAVARDSEDGKSWTIYPGAGSRRYYVNPELRFATGSGTEVGRLSGYTGQWVFERPGCRAVQLNLLTREWDEDAVLIAIAESAKILLAN